MNKLTKGICIFLFIILIIQQGAVIQAKENNPAERMTATEEYMNPFYEKDSEELILVEEDAKTLHSSETSALNEEDYGAPLTEEKIVEKIRNGMVNRESNIIFAYQNTTGYDTGDMKRWVQLALEETDNANEGDYLRWNYQKYESSVKYYCYEDVYHFTYDLTMTYFTTKEQEAQLESNIKEVLGEIGVNNPDLSDYEKTKRIYDYICQHVVYDTEHEEDDTYTLKYTAYAALVNKTAVCQGYATLLYRMLEECDIDTRIVHGMSQGRKHAWNIVNLGSVYYLADATRDAGEDEYSYFLRSESEFKDYNAQSDYLDQYIIAEQNYSPVSISVDIKEIDMTIGENRKINATVNPYSDEKIQWTSGNEAIAVVDDNGVITAVGDGTVYIRAAVPGDKALCKVSVTHTHVEKVTIEAKEATCMEAGCTEGTNCEICGMVMKASEIIEPKAHWVYTTKEAKEATCTEDGYTEEKKCLRCRNIIQESEVIIAAHNYINNRCTKCGNEKPYTKINFNKTETVCTYTGDEVHVAPELITITEGNSEFVLQYFRDNKCQTPTNEGKDEEEMMAPISAGVYYARAVAMENEDYQQTVTDTVHKIVIRPRKVSSFKASNHVEGIQLTWKRSKEATGYILYRRTANSDFKVIKKLKKNTALSFIDTKVKTGTKYYYNIVAYKIDVDGEQAMGLKLSENKKVIRTKVHSVKNQNGSVKITWTKVPKAAGYKVYRMVEGKKAARLKTVKSGKTTSYVDKSSNSIKNGRVSTYYVIPYYKKSDGTIMKSAVKSNCYLKTPKAPTVESKKKALKIKWKKNSSAEGYQIRYSTSKSMKGAKTVTVSSKSTLNKTVKNLKRYRTYYVQIRSYKTYEKVEYYSAWSLKKKAKTK